MELNCKISSNLENLNKCNKIHSWIPNSENIRPNQEICDKKLLFFEEINAFYESDTDYILSEIFDCDTKLNENGKLQAIDNRVKFKFIKNIFPYDLPDETNHFVMWYKKKYSELNESIINMNIYNELHNLLNHKNFNFVWYENPKMSIDSMYHLHVFWIENK